MTLKWINALLFHNVSWGALIMLEWFQKKKRLFPSLILPSDLNTVFEGACLLRDFSVNAHCCDWLTALHMK